MTKGMAIETLSHGNFDNYYYVYQPLRGVSFLATYIYFFLSALKNSSNNSQNSHGCGFERTYTSAFLSKIVITPKKPLSNFT